MASCVESDFSILGVEKDEYRKSLLDLFFDSSIHEKQFKELKAI